MNSLELISKDRFKHIKDDNIREGDVIVETNINEHPRLNFISEGSREKLQH